MSWQPPPPSQAGAPAAAAPLPAHAAPPPPTSSPSPPMAPGLLSAAPPLGSVRMDSMQSGFHSFSVDERRGFSEYINELLGDVEHLREGGLLPLDPASDDLFTRVRSGVLLCALVEKVRPGSIDAKMVKHAPRNQFDEQANLNLVVSACRSIGVSMVNIGHLDLFAGTPHLVMGLVWQVIRLKLMDAVNVERHPELVALCAADENASSFVNMKPEDSLLRWFNYHLERGQHPRRVANFASDIQDGDAYLVLLNQLRPGIVDLRALGDTNLPRKSAYILDAAERMGVRKFLQPQDIYQANGKLNLAFVANLFDKYPGIDLAQLDRERTERKQRELEEQFKRKLQVEEEERRSRWQAEEDARRGALDREETERRARLEDEEKQRREQWAREEEQRKRRWEEEERSRLAAIQAREDEAQRKREADELELRRREEQARAAEQQRQQDMARQAAELERRRREAEEEARRAEEERARQQAEEERRRAEEARYLAAQEAEQRRKAWEEEQRRKAWEEEQRRKAWEEEQRRIADEQARIAEQQRQAEQQRAWQEEQERQQAAERQRVWEDEQRARAWQEQQARASQAQLASHYPSQQQLASHYPQQQQQPHYPPPQQQHYPPPQQHYPSPQYSSTTTTTTTYEQQQRMPAPVAHVPAPKPAQGFPCDIEITIEEVRGLKKSDLLGLGKSDPYVIVRMRDQYFRSTQRHDTRHAVWREGFILRNVQRNDEVEVSVWDKDTIGKDDFLGEVRLVQRHFTSLPQQRQWHMLRGRLGREHKDKAQGDLCLSLVRK